MGGPFVVAARDFDELASRILAALLGMIRPSLQTRSLLFVALVWRSLTCEHSRVTRTSKILKILLGDPDSSGRGDG